MDNQTQELVLLAPRPLKGTQKPPTLDPVTHLSKRQRHFVEYYLQGNSAKKSAELAGYSPVTAAVAHSIILKNPNIIAEIRKRGDEYFKDLKIDTDWIIQEATKMASANMFDYIEVKEDGTFKVNLKTCTRDMGAAIQELSYDPEGRPKIRLADKKASVELLARIKKLFSDQDDHSRDKGDTLLTMQALDQIVQNVTINQYNVVQSQERQDTPMTIER